MQVSGAIGAIRSAREVIEEMIAEYNATIETLKHI